LLRKQFPAFEDSVNASEGMECLQWAGKIELLAVLVNQDIEITLRNLGKLTISL
jgi:hypothetical protein